MAEPATRRDHIGRQLPSREVTDRIRSLANSLDSAREDLAMADGVDSALEELERIAQGCMQRRRSRT